MPWHKQPQPFPPNEDSAELMRLTPALECAAGPGERLLPTSSLCSQGSPCASMSVTWEGHTWVQAVGYVRCMGTSPEGRLCL